jgi:hypothetical protein
MNESKKELVGKLFSYIKSGKRDEAGALLSENFMFSGPVPEPVDKKDFLEMHFALLKAIPDWSFNEHDIQEQGNQVKLKVKISGTHTKELNLPSLGIKSAATNKRISLPEEKCELTFEGDKISNFSVEKVTGGGLMGILSQLGIKMPVPVEK